MRTPAFLLVLALSAATVYSQAPAPTVNLHAPAATDLTEGSQADRDSLYATEVENNTPSSTPEEHRAVLKRNMWDGTLTTVSPTGIRQTRSSTIINGGANRAPDPPGVKREARLFNYVVNVYNGTTGLIGYDHEAIESGHADPAQNKSTYTHCMDVFVKKDNHWYGLSHNCIAYQPEAK
jgi:hypothetical protein